MRKPVFGISDQVWHKPGCTTTEDGYSIEISDLESRGTVLLCSENKGAVQLPCYHAADLRLCFCICKKTSFLMTQLKLYISNALKVILTHSILCFKANTKMQQTELS